MPLKTLATQNTGRPSAVDRVQLERKKEKQSYGTYLCVMDVLISANCKMRSKAPNTLDYETT
jgi:ribosomal protein L34E